MVGLITYTATVEKSRPCQRPAALLADEPTGNLDSRTGTAVFGRMAATVHERGKSVLCVTHDHRVR